MAGKRTGEERKSSPTDPAVVETSDGPVLVYRLPRGKVGILHPPGTRVVKKTKTVDKGGVSRSNPL